MKILCFECGRKAQFNHHVIPKSLGGKRTIPLCEKCHSKVHESKFVKLGNLIREGMAKAKRNGINIGRPSKNHIYYNQIKNYFFGGYSTRETAKLLNIPKSSVGNIYKQIKHEYSHPLKKEREKYE